MNVIAKEIELEFCIFQSSEGSLSKSTPKYSRAFVQETSSK